MSTETKKAKALELAITQIDRQFGKGSIMKLGDNTVSISDNVISTGCLSLDVALGVGGVPKGRIIEIYGPESSGKTTLALHIVAEAQKAGGFAAFIDAEHAVDPEYSKKLGVNIEELLISQPDTGEQALEICETLVRSGALDVIVIDSVAALVPRAELEGDMGDSHMGLQARLMSQALRKLTGTVSRSNTCVIFINQIREKIGIVFGNPETTPGGRALKFYSSVRMEIRRITTIKDGLEMVGSRVRVKVVKNKVASPFKKSEFDIMYGQGISYVGDMIDLAVEGNIVEKTGAWYSYEDMKIGQGRENAKSFLMENDDIMASVTEKVKSFMGLNEDKDKAEA
ncbi:MAG: recombinase RecA [Candidatus Marinimicrobia bacterium]|jgi:recombination protein RecA|nr:recombinase RecA [Candidatus Neomarinimicrobiota bacterium]MBT4752941.1 recombinase RecA [Candidatus Neomarinimicrobiota bacterium]MBT5114652.1 recombinase RecA [Candidatus Neomarinimicrobiota bacterium]MBT6414341.1 recombinase RecA [Candidatus Neomarinimicrobiota bacterium]MBT6796422.1 recombinase RecA [Candidatus Neomarinimicrobiota bacterium]|tara:strand:- start:2651 stop:3673 length:1023 start_codon:yes stop_codon:yes gene_type:complete